MAWRLHLTNQGIGRLDLLRGVAANDQPLLAAWLRRDRVAFFDVETGTAAADYTLKMMDARNRRDERWPEFVSGLVAPNKAFLPVVQAGTVTIYASLDGKLRLYHVDEADLFLDVGGGEVQLKPVAVFEAEVEFIAAGLDPLLGTVAAIAADGKLHIFQQHIHIGAFDVGLQPDEEMRPLVAMAQGGRGAAIFVSDGRSVVLTDSGGTILKRLNTHYFINMMACSANGAVLATSDIEAGVVRVYDGAELLPTRQRHAIDLVATATQVQLMADLPPLSIALSALTI
ncbi:MAG: hypothetical protein H7175_27280, partial [Burkholderiales bacterium]|nr:hypothetical protein [Anaerolineae bacterium]